MTFIPKDWKNLPDISTPFSAEAVEDQEIRLAAYTDSRIAATEAALEADVAALEAATEADVAASRALRPINVLDSLFPFADVIRDGRDNSAALQSRHDLSETTGRPVYYPGGADYIAANIQYGGNAHIFGDGFSTCIKLKAGAVAATGTVAYSHKNIFVNKHGATTGDIGLEIHHMRLDGNVANNAVDEFYFAIAAWSVKKIQINHIWVHDHRGDAVVVGRNPSLAIDCEDVQIHHLFLERIGEAFVQRQGISVIQGKRVQITDIIGVRVGGIVVDVEPDSDLQAVEDVTIEHIIAYNGGTSGGGVAVSHQGSAQILNLTVRDVKVKDGPDAAMTRILTAGNVMNLVAEDLSSSTLTYAEAVSLTGITGGRVSRVSCPGTITAVPGILLTNCVGLKVTDCDLPNTGGSQTYGVAEAGSSNNNIIAGNVRLGGDRGKTLLVGANSVAFSNGVLTKAQAIDTKLLVASFGISAETFQREVAVGDSWGTPEIGSGPWEISFGGSGNTQWSVANNLGLFQVKNTVSTGNRIRGTRHSDQRVEYKFDGLAVGGSFYTGFLARYRSVGGPDGDYVSMRVRHNSSNRVLVMLSRIIGGVTTSTAEVDIDGATINQWYTMRFNVKDDTIKGKVWNSASAEPQDWQVTMTDASIGTMTNTGGNDIGIRNPGPSGTGLPLISYRNYIARDIG